MFAGWVTETPPAAAVRGIETDEEGLFEPEAEPEDDARDAVADWEDDMIGDRLWADDQVKDADCFVYLLEEVEPAGDRGGWTRWGREIVKTRKEYR